MYLSCLYHKVTKCEKPYLWENIVLEIHFLSFTIIWYNYRVKWQKNNRKIGKFHMSSNSPYFGFRSYFGNYSSSIQRFCPLFPNHWNFLGFEMLLLWLRTHTGPFQAYFSCNNWKMRKNCSKYVKMRRPNLDGFERFSAKTTSNSCFCLFQISFFQFEFSWCWAFFSHVWINLELLVFSSVLGWCSSYRFLAILSHLEE